MREATEKTTLYLLNTDVYYELYKCSRRSHGVLLMIHGFVSSSYSFRALIPYLRKKYDIITVDLPGFGRSAKRHDFRYSFDNYSNLIAAFITHMALTNVTLIGHSMGGQVALYTAKKFPNLVNYIVLLSSSGYLKRVKRSYVYATYLPFAQTFIRRWLQKKDYKKAINQVVYNKKMVSDDVVREYSRPFNEEAFYDSLICLVRQREGDLTASELQMISQPCLILWGEEDKIIPVRIGKRLASDLPRSQFFSFKKTGHLVPEERPKEVSQKIKRFLQNPLKR
ncbi:alpha/beta fold hydrolase [Halalkalibacter urbisdiaboli]|uniref:alpha/beta fold hydrolase n=1 Tax=Halalkalibacter urbisdiaboli TaxID=1960589 RepID=UPI000B4403DD|nr:alpha/beta hydrolase [Halalkalibacter urbisdiaboli]